MISLKPSSRGLVLAFPGKVQTFASNPFLANTLADKIRYITKLDSKHGNQAEVLGIDFSLGKARGNDTSKSAQEGKAVDPLQAARGKTQAHPAEPSERQAKNW